MVAEVNVSFVAGVLSIAGSIIAAYLSYEIYKYNRLHASWLAVTWAFILVILRRSIGFVIDFGFFPGLGAFLKSVEGVLLLLISVLYIWGFWSMLKSFENFDVIEKKVTSKLRAFKRLKK